MFLHLHHLSPPINISLVNYSEKGGSNTIQNPDKLLINMVSNPRQMQSCINCLLLMVCSSLLDSNYMAEKVTVTDCYQRILQARSRIMNYYGFYI